MKKVSTIFIVLALVFTLALYPFRRASAAIAVTNLENFSGTVDATSFATGSVTPTANALILLTVSSRTDTGTPNTPTASGNNLTWVVVRSTHYDIVGSQRKLTVFRAMGASPSAGAITINFGGQTQSAAAWIVDEVTGVDTSGTNGSGAIVQSVANQNTGGAVSTLTVTLAAFSSTDNATYGAFGWGNTSGGTVGSGFTLIASEADAEVTQEVLTEWKSTNDTSVDVSFGVAATVGGVGIELKLASVVVVATGFGKVDIQNSKVIINGKVIIQ